MKRILTLLLALAICFSMVACGNTKPAVEPTAEPAAAPATETNTEANTETTEWYGNSDGTPITLKVWGGIQPEYGYDQMVEKFNKEFADKGIQVEYTRYVNDDDGNLQLETYLMGGNDIDIYMGYGGVERLFKRIDAGLALDMGSYLKDAGFDPIEELGESNVASYIYNDTYYALPTKYENKCWMVVNADMFANAGIELPLNGWTYEQFAEAGKKLSSGEGQDKVYGMFWNMNGGWKNAIEFIGATLGKYKTYTDDTCTATNMDNAVWQQGLQLIVDSQNDGWGISLEQEVADGIDFSNAFLKGKAAMASGIFNLRVIKDLEKYPHDFETAIVPYPVPDESYLADSWSYSDCPGAGDLILVNPKSAHVAEAMDFVLWYIKGGMAPLASGGRIPLWKGFDANLVVDALCQTEGVFNVDSIKAYMGVDASKAYATLSSSVESKIATVKQEEMQAALYGQKTVEQACQDMKSRSDDLLK